MKICNFAQLDDKARASVCEQIATLEAFYYGEGFSRSKELLKDCFSKSPHTVCLAFSFNKFIAAYDFYSLAPDFYEGLRNGTVAEEQLCASAIIPRSPDLPSKNNWYIASIVSDPNSELRGEAFKKLVRTAQRLKFGMSEKESVVLGVGSSAFGKTLLSDWGFEPVQPSSLAIDLRPRFEKTLVQPKDIFSLHL